ncbi:MAG: hypothetical protein MUF71_21365 [Candidatus Kapabacteria bacterium]|jgi:hypothetical protein|nr:hypothetical protein [Candidatus Kapabacteria bacterium]
MRNPALFQALHEHYKETFADIREHIKQRDMFFIGILIFLTIVLFQAFSPDEYKQLIGQVLAKQLETKAKIDVGFLSSLSLFILLYLVLRYCQLSVIIERRYNYIQELESELSKKFTNKKMFTREGGAYLQNYPKISNWAHWIYTSVFPCALLLCVAINFVSNWQLVTCERVFGGIINTVLDGLITITVLLYMYNRYFEQ